MRTTGIEFVSQGQAAFCKLGEPPEPGPRQILIETKYSGLTNGTERHALLGEHGYGGRHYPGRHGYQHVGEIVAVGPDVPQYEKGDWVFYGAYVGHRGWHVADESDLMIRLPEDVDRKYCALFGVAGVALRAVRRMGVSAGDNVWVVGQGPIGHFCGQAARAVGAEVTVTDVSEQRLEIAKQAGAHRTLNATDEGYWEALKGVEPYDYIFDCCSPESLFFDIFEHGLLAFGGTIGAMAVRDTATFPWSLLHGRQAKIEVSCHFQADDLRVLLHLYRRGAIKIEPMVTHLVPINDALRIYEMLGSGAQDLLGVIFNWA